MVWEKLGVLGNRGKFELKRDKTPKNASFWVQKQPPKKNSKTYPCCIYDDCKLFYGATSALNNKGYA